MTVVQRSLRPHTPQVDAVRRLIAEQIAPVAGLREELLERWTIRPSASDAESRMRAGHPALDAAAVIASVRGRTTAYVRVCDAFEEAAVAAEREARDARAARDTVGALLEAWLRGDRLPRAGAPRLARVAAAFVGGCILEAASRALPASLPVDRWIRSCCPHCGGQPDFALVHDGGRRLVCSRCNMSWHSAASGCIGCGESRSPVLARIPSPIGYRLAICNSCGRYLKERDTDETIDPFLERALTAQLDAAAEARGLRL